MSLIHADNFSIYGTDSTLLLNGIYANVANSPALVVDPDGVSPGYVLDTKGGTGSGWIRYVLPGARDTVGMAARLWMPHLPTDTTGPVSFAAPAMWMQSTVGGSNVMLYVDTLGKIKVVLGADVDDTLLAESSTPVVTSQGWYHIEWKVTGDAVAGTVDVRVEGVEVISETGLNTGSGDIELVFIGVDSDASGGSSTHNYWKDYVVWDSLGTENNDFFGTVQVKTLLPISDVSLNWTPSTGTTGYSILDNIPPSTTYISAEDAPLPSPYVAELEDLPADTTSVRGLITYVRAAKVDGGDGTLQVGLISDPDGTPATDLGADRAITTAQTYWRDVSELDPATAAQWTPTAVNLAQLQIDRTT